MGSRGPESYAGPEIIPDPCPSPVHVSRRSWTTHLHCVAFCCHPSPPLGNPRQRMATQGNAWQRKATNPVGPLAIFPPSLPGLVPLFPGEQGKAHWRPCMRGEPCNESGAGTVAERLYWQRVGDF